MTTTFLRSLRASFARPVTFAATCAGALLGSTLGACTDKGAEPVPSVAPSLAAGPAASTRLVDIGPADTPAGSPPPGEGNCKGGEGPDDDTVRRETVDVEGSPSLGNPEAPVTVVVFSDFDCPFCARGAVTERALVDAYGGKVRLVFKNRPLPIHEGARAKASLARASGAKFWELHDRLFANARTKEGSDGHARAVGLDPNELVRHANDASVAERIAKDVAEGDRLAISGVPTYFVNGRRITGARGEDAFRTIIDEELAHPIR
ncbi:MAG: thioredoxin domain-containing protein [Polyangiaceae bacterium]